MESQTRFHVLYNSLHNIKFGWNYTYCFIPSVSASSEDVEFNTGETVKFYGNEAVYVLDEFDLTENLKNQI